MFRVPRRLFASFSSVSCEVVGLFWKLGRILDDAGLDTQLGKFSIRIYKIEIQATVYIRVLGSISPTFYKQLLRVQIPKAQKSCLT